MKSPRLAMNLARLIVLCCGLAIWQWGYQWSQAGIPLVGIFDPYFFSTPSAMWSRFLRLACLVDRQGGWALAQPGTFSACLYNGNNNIWLATAATLRNTFWGFMIGVPSGIVLGLILGRSKFLAATFQPFITALYSVPKIALAPLLVLMLGFGDSSKIFMSWFGVLVLVFFNTFEGCRSVDKDYIATARLLGASRSEVLRTVIIPSTLAWVFAVLSPAASFALLGVIVAEFIGANFGLGRLIVDAQSRAEATDMMIAVVILMIVGVLISAVIRRAQRYLLRWQPEFHFSE
jgi:NitT/TauT family transport system permease protein